MNKEAAQEVARFRRLGWQAEERGGHIHLTHPDHDKVVMASTASDHRAVQNNRANVAAAMGISKSELEVRMGQRQRKRKGKRSRKRKGPGQQSSLIARSLPAHRAPVAPPPAAPVLPPLPASLLPPQPPPATLRYDRANVESFVREARETVELDPNRLCLWCGDPLPRPVRAGRPKTTCSREHAQKVSTLRNWFRPIQLLTHEQVVWGRQIRERAGKR